jgi:hypothetical protein
MDSHPSDKNKDVRWMGHSFIPRGSVKPVGDFTNLVIYKDLSPQVRQMLYSFV